MYSYRFTVSDRGLSFHYLKKEKKVGNFFTPLGARA
jgi:hypothetical protein